MKTTLQQRLKVWRKLAQTAADPAPTDTTATPAPSFTIPVLTVFQIPTFKAALFSAYPPFIGDLNTLINTFNKYLMNLSGGKISFDMLHTNPSTSGSAFTNGLKNLYNVSKWFYQILSANKPQPYSTDDLRKIITDLSSSINKYDFPEPKAAPLKNDIVSTCQSILNKLGNR